MDDQKDASQGFGQQAGGQGRKLSRTNENKHGVGAAQALTIPDIIAGSAGHDEVRGGGFLFVEPDGETVLPFGVGAAGRALGCSRSMARAILDQ